MKYSVVIQFAAVLCAIFTPPVHAQDADKVCGVVTEGINSRTPMKIDKYTTLMSSTCVPHERRTALSYFYRIEMPASEQMVQALPKLRSTNVKRWCTDPDQKKLLGLMDVQYRYTALDGTFVGSFFVQREDCQGAL